jgi:hypothetical protein
VHQGGLELHCFCSRIAAPLDRINAENRLYSFALTMPRRALTTPVYPQSRSRRSACRARYSIALPASAVEAAPFFQPSGALCGGCLRPTWFGRWRTVVCVISFSFGVSRPSGMLRAAYSSKICPGPNDEFMTLMWFTDHEAIVRFAGPDWETAVVPASARAVLFTLRRESGAL